MASVAPEPQLVLAPSLRVLVVDDDLLSRTLVVESLRQAGMLVVEADDGRAALEAFDANPPDVVLMDVLMPIMDGFTACAELRSMPNGAHVPVLMVTGLEDEESINRAYEAGATDFVAKPLNYTLLVHRVRYMARTGAMTEQLYQGERRLRAAQRIANLGSWEWDARTDRFWWSDAALGVLGADANADRHSIDALLARVPSAEREWVGSWFADVRNDAERSNLGHRLIDGTSERHVRQVAEPQRDAQGQLTHLYGTIQDITELRENEAHIRRLAYFDPLTGLPNRTFFLEILERSIKLALRHQRHGALLFIDLDNFKQINDTLGHAMGDALLEVVAERLQSCVRASDLVVRDEGDEGTRNVARLGGDEFTVLLPELEDEHSAATVAARLVEALGRPYALPNNEVVVTPSIGVTVFPEDGTSAADLMRNGDMAMYHSKHAGKNTFHFYDSSMHELAQRRMRMESALRRAVGNQELTLAYQPQYDLRSGALTGTEALIRWQDPELGHVSPADFIPLAEETGLIAPLGEWVMRTACIQMQTWREAGTPVPRVAVNVSVRQFESEAFPDQVRKALAAAGLEPAALELEVTESLLMSQADEAIGTLKVLKAIGVELAVDDFGTGYSSLSYLKRFPLDRLKIDRAFVKDIDSDPENAAIAMAVIAMAGSMNLQVTAEGIETQAEFDFLATHSCDEAQGFLLSRPIQPEQIGSVMRVPLAAGD